jgi:hypothetical protein
MATFGRTRTVSWTKDRIDALTTPEVRQLRANAERLREPEIAVLCDEVLGARRKKSRTAGRAA